MTNWPIQRTPEEIEADRQCCARSTVDIHANIVAIREAAGRMSVWLTSVSGSIAAQEERRSRTTAIHQNHSEQTVKTIVDDLFRKEQ